MKLREIGEFGFIDRVSEQVKDLLLPGYLGIGDDCAVIPFTGKEDYMVTTDLLIEDIHFLKNRITPEELGYKSLAVSLSDIAAKGGTPVASFLSIGIPAETEVGYLDSFIKGYYELSRKYRVQLLGGDTTESKEYIVINVGVIGKCGKGEARLRSMAMAGDIICVTGCLGDSAAGLQVLLQNLPRTHDHLRLIRIHHMPDPHIKEGLWLAGYPEVHAMMDVSDGISSDLPHILKSSGKSAVVNLDKIPVSATLKKVAPRHGWDIDKLATSGGEDYVLLCTVSPDSFERINAGFNTAFGRDLYNIGGITPGKNRIKWLKNGKEVLHTQHGFDHFSA